MTEVSVTVIVAIGLASFAVGFSLCNLIYVLCHFQSYYRNNEQEK